MKKDGNSIKIKEMATRDEAVSLLTMWKKYWNPEPEEMSETEEIMQCEGISKEMKELLIKSLKNVDCIVKPTDGGSSYKTTRLRVDARKSAEKALEENQINIDSKWTKSKEQDDLSK